MLTARDITFRCRENFNLYKIYIFTENRNTKTKSRSDDLIDLKAVCQYFRFSESTVRRKIRDAGILPYRNIGVFIRSNHASKIRFIRSTIW
jgi:hypothetical protein